MGSDTALTSVRVFPFGKISQRRDLITNKLVKNQQNSGGNKHSFFAVKKRNFKRIFVRSKFCFLEKFQ